MTARGEGERFLAAFNELKTAVGDDPNVLSERWEGDEHLQKLCDEISSLVFGFRVKEEWSPYAFTQHVSVAGAHARRDYDDRWCSIVGTIAYRDMVFLLRDIIGNEEEESASDDKPVPDRLAEDIEDWKDTARSEARAIASIIDYAREQHESDEHGDFECLYEGLRAWDRLEITGIDIKGALWRRRAIPHVLVPTHVARHYGASRASLYRRLHQASRAYIFGAPLAALALQRAVLEEVLQRHWGAERGATRNADFPEWSWGWKADKLKKLGNKALHGDPEDLTSDQLDRAIINNFLLLRLLIEHAPEKVVEE